MTPSRRLEGHRAYGHAADAFDAVAWRPPAAHRFDPRVANDMPGRTSPERHASSAFGDLPGWLTVVAGGFAAALIGALLGGALQV